MRLLLACSVALSVCAAGALAQTGPTIATRQVGTATLQNVPEISADVTAAEDWELAGSAVEFLGLPELELEDEDEQVPAGDLDLLGDLGMHAMEMGLLLDDVDLYPDELLSDVARRLGFGEQFDDAVGLTSA